MGILKAKPKALVEKQAEARMQDRLVYRSKREGRDFESRGQGRRKGTCTAVLGRMTVVLSQRRHCVPSGLRAVTSPSRIPGIVPSRPPTGAAATTSTRTAVPVRRLRLEAPAVLGLPAADP